jgi:hypothetical protein
MAAREDAGHEGQPFIPTRNKASMNCVSRTIINRKTRNARSNAESIAL